MTFKIFPIFLVTALALSALSAAVTPKHKISAERAAKIALKRFPGKLKGTPHLEHEDGVWQYEVLVKTGGKLKEINVNADSGKIGSVETTSAKEEAREAKEEKGKDKKGTEGKEDKED